VIKEQEVILNIINIMKNKRDFRIDKTIRSETNVFEINTCGENMFVAVVDEKIKGINWKDRIYASVDLRTDKFIHLLAWLIPCRENRHVVKTMNDFIINS